MPHIVCFELPIERLDAKFKMGQDTVLATIIIQERYISALFDLMRLVSSAETVASFEKAYNSCTIRYGDMKKALAEDMVAFIRPIRERASALQADEDALRKILKRGAEQARESASKTISLARRGIGIHYY